MKFNTLKESITKLFDPITFSKAVDYVHADPDGYNTVLINPIISASNENDKSIADKITNTGANTGNLLFSQGIRNQLSYQKEIWLFGNDVASVEKPACIMPSANFIIHGDDTFIKICRKFLDDTTCPVTLAGLGAQSTPELNTPKKLVDVLSETKKIYFKELSERAVTLGIRGEFTAECLELMGIHNYRIIGCPSAYFSLDGKGPKMPKPSLKRCQITVTTGSKYESQILKAGKDLNAVWMMQMMTEMPECAFEGKRVSPVWVDRRFPELQLSVNEFTQYMRGNAKIFFSLDDWNQFYKESKLTFAFGSRFHGNMAAFRNGIPALWIIHDSRTTELVRTLHLPYITQDCFGNIKYYEELLSYCDYTEFNKNYKKMLKNYIQFLEENHISHRFVV